MIIIFRRALNDFTRGRLLIRYLQSSHQSIYASSHIESTLTVNLQYEDDGMMNKYYAINSILNI